MTQTILDHLAHPLGNDGPSLKRFILAGNAIFTLVSHRTGVRLTYKVRAAGNWGDQNGTSFVSVLSGSDNDSDYLYLGIIRNGSYRWTDKSSFTLASQQNVGFDYLWRCVLADKIPREWEVLHAGRCGRCGRTLTVPESIISGFGPECAGKVD